MTAKRAFIIGLSLLMLTGMRDPFRPPDDRCHIAELNAWRFQGALGSGTQLTGFLKDARQKWRRVQQDGVLDNGWRIREMTAQSLTIETGSDCEPSQWQWQRQGDVRDTQAHDAKVDNARDSGVTDRHPARRAGGKGQQRNARGG